MTHPSRSVAAAPGVIAAIRHAIGPIHRRLEETTLAQALFHGTVDGRIYRQLLVELTALHVVIDGWRAQDPDLWSMFGDPPLRGEALAADRRALGVADGAEVRFPALAATFTALGSTREGRAGVLFVTEGSRQGSRLLRDPVARALGIPVAPGQGLDYHLQAPDPQAWPLTIRRLDTHPWPAPATLVNGAVEAMELLFQLYTADLQP